MADLNCQDISALFNPRLGLFKVLGIFTAEEDTGQTSRSDGRFAEIYRQVREGVSVEGFPGVTVE